MKLRSYESARGEGRRIRSLAKCIYCLRLPREVGELTDEHVIPFAISANSIIFLQASCRQCARKIQPYEQDVLLKQLGNFRRQIDAPSRTRPKKRRRHANVKFKEVDARGQDIRPLGDHSIPIAELPLALCLWQLPEPRIIRPNAFSGDDTGRPWYRCYEDAALNKLCRKIADKTGSKNVAIEIGLVSRESFLRFLAKTAHAYAVAELGLNAFEPFLTDIILNAEPDITQFVGGYGGPPPPGRDPESVMSAHIGQLSKGPYKEWITVVLQFYPALDTPMYSVIVGKAMIDMNHHAVDMGYDVSG